jgi:CRP/FNR family transcriptional regulator
MDCNAGGALFVAPGMGGTACFAGQLPDPAPIPRADASLCMTCPVRGLCVGGLAAEAGTRQLRSLLADRQRLQAGDVVHTAGEPFQFLQAVRSGSLASVTSRRSGQQVRRLHFPGELAGVDGALGGVHASTVIALEDTEICALRFGGCHSLVPAGAAFAGRLWDMVSRELLGERSHAAWLAGLSPKLRVVSFLASLPLRVRAQGAAAREFRLHLSPTAIADYLRVPPETADRVLEALQERGLVEVGPHHVRILHPEWLQREAKRQSRG